MAFKNYAAAARQHDNACDCCDHAGDRHREQLAMAAELRAELGEYVAPARYETLGDIMRPDGTIPPLQRSSHWEDYL